MFAEWDAETKAIDSFTYSNLQFFYNNKYVQLPLLSHWLSIPCPPLLWEGPVIRPDHPLQTHRKVIETFFKNRRNNIVCSLAEK